MSKNLTKQQVIDRYGPDEWERRKLKKRENNKRWEAKNKEWRLNYDKEWRNNHPKECVLRNKKWYDTNGKDYHYKYRKGKKGRAVGLICHYNFADKQRGFDTSNNITAEWIVENIFTSKCVYCGREEWETLGADRIDNSKPHTPDNVVCCCGICNAERQDSYSVEEFKRYKQLRPTLIWEPVTKNEDGSLKKRNRIKL